MPYIPPKRRPWLDPSDDNAALTAGELNYQFTRLIAGYVEAEGLSYAAINDVLGALEGAKAEFYRRVAVPYEDAKLAENGDVYPAALTGEAAT